MVLSTLAAALVMIVGRSDSDNVNCISIVMIKFTLSGSSRSTAHHTAPGSSLLGGWAYHPLMSNHPGSRPHPPARRHPQVGRRLGAQITQICISIVMIKFRYLDRTKIVPEPCPSPIVAPDHSDPFLTNTPFTVYTPHPR